MKILLLFAFLFSITSVFAQDVDSYIEQLKSEIKADKKALITETMAFTEKESQAFWPIYTDFEYDLDKLSSKRISNIKDFAANYDSLTDAKADELIKNSFSFMEDRLSLNKKTG